MRPTVGRNKEWQEALRSLLELVSREESLIFSQMNIIEAPTLRRVMNSHSVGTSIYGPWERPRIRSLLTRCRARSGSLDHPNLMSRQSWDPQCHHRQRMSKVHPPTLELEALHLRSFVSLLIYLFHRLIHSLLTLLIKLVLSLSYLVRIEARLPVFGPIARSAIELCILNGESHVVVLVPRSILCLPE